MVDSKFHARAKVTIPNAQDSNNTSRREAFWKQLKSDTSLTHVVESDAQRLEGELVRAVPRELARLLVNSIAAPLTNAARVLEENDVRYGLRELEHWLMHMPGDRKYAPFSLADFSVALVQLAELRTSQLRDTPNYAQILERISFASRVHISAKIISYSSLEFGLSFGNIEALSKAFESNFESFQVFLDVFVPRAFENTFLSSNGHGYEWTVRIEPDFEAAFSQGSQKTAPPLVTAQQATLPSPAQTIEPSVAIQKSEWLWRLANGSLLVPVVILIGVLFFTIQEVGKARSMQADALKPVIEYYQQLLQFQQKKQGPDTSQASQGQAPNTAVERDAPKAARSSP